MASVKDHWGFEHDYNADSGRGTLKIFKLNGDDPIETEEFVLPSDLANRDDLNEITCKWMDDFNNLSPEERGEKYGGSFIEYMRAKLNAAPGSSAGQ